MHHRSPPLLQLPGHVCWPGGRGFAERVDLRCLRGRRGVGALGDLAADLPLELVSAELGAMCDAGDLAAMQV